jgi:nucleotide-binding universal stress UspA family protein
LDADLVVLGKTGWSRRRRVGSTTQVMVVQSPRETFILQRRVRRGLPIMVAYDGSAAGSRALAAAHLVRTEDSPVRILIVASDHEAAQRLQAEAQSRLSELEMEAQFTWRPDLDGTKLARMARSEGCGVFVLPTETGKLSGDMVITFLNESECAVLLVR